MKLKRLKVPIFTEEYSVVVLIGARKGIVTAAARYLGCSYKAVEDDFGNCRGRAWNALDPVYGKKHPIIAINGELPAHIALATVAHESSHAMDFIENFIGVNDRNGEFHAHGISAIMRAVGGLLLDKSIKK